MYLYDITKHFDSKKAEPKAIIPFAQSILDYQGIVYSEFRQISTTCLMFLENILTAGLNVQVQEGIQIAIFLINLLLSLVNDTLDLQAMFEDKFVPSVSKFSPKVTL